MYLHKTAKEMKEQISRELREAVRDMRANGYRAIRYDPHLLMIDNQGDRYGDPVWYKGILTRKLIEDVVAHEGSAVARIVYCNGIDGAASPREMYQYDEYTPDVEVVEIDVWVKD